MIRSHLAVALRILLRHPGYSAINVVGLGVGLAATLLIALFVADELSYDRFQRDADRLVRVTEQVIDESGAGQMERVLIDPGWAPLLGQDLPEVEQVVRLTPVGPDLAVGDRTLSCGRCYYVDADLLDVLTIPLVRGEPGTALAEPRSFLLSRSRAVALFGNVDVVGSAITVNGDPQFTVTGVFEDTPGNTHLPLDGIGTLSSFAWFDGVGWDSPNYATYVKLAAGTSPAEFGAKLAGLVDRHRGPEVARRAVLRAQRVLDIHLYSHRVGELGINGSASTVWLLAAVALFILAIACINFMNLSTARSSLRAKEVGVRKATGAHRGQLVRQFLGESILLTLLALVLAAVIAQLALPVFNAFTGKSVQWLTAGTWWAPAALVATGLLTGLAAGAWPAFFLSSFKPATVLRGNRGSRSAGGRLRSFLVVVQFAIAIVLAVSTVVVFRQIDYMQSRPLGYDREDVLVLPVIWDLKEQFGPVADRLEAHPDILRVAQSNPVPGSQLHTAIEVSREDEGAGRLETVSLYAVWADAGFFDAYGIGVTAGRNFADEFASDADTGFILNERAVARLGFASPQAAVASPLRVGGWRGEVIGVVEDIHFESLHQPIAPQIYYMDPRNYRAVSARIAPGADANRVAESLRQEWARHEPSGVFSWSVLDDRLRQLYDGERRLGQLIAMFAGLALLVTCLGVFGLSAFAAERRTREIGIRRVFGASGSSIVALLNRDMLRLVAVALILALPLGIVGATRWLDSFAYRSGLPWLLLAGVAVAFAALAMVTVSLQAARAAAANPVDSLRSE